MRLTLQNYLKMDDTTISSLAKKIGRTRECVRRWRDNEALTTIVHFDTKTGDVEKVEVGKITTIDGVKSK